MPKCADNAHREVEDNLELILAKHEIRTISKNLEIQYKNKIYQIETKSPSYTMKYLISKI